MTNLPEKFSAGIRLAIEDMKKCEANPDYTIDMGRWHKVKDGVCHVCMAGAVMAQTLGAGKGDTVSIYDSKYNDVEDQLDAFDTLRSGGYIFAHADYTGKNLTTSSVEAIDKSLPEFIPYEEDKEKFYNWCLAVADAFEKIGE